MFLGSTLLTFATRGKSARSSGSKQSKQCVLNKGPHHRQGEHHRRNRHGYQRCRCGFAARLQRSRDDPEPTGYNRNECDKGDERMDFREQGERSAGNGNDGVGQRWRLAKPTCCVGTGLSNTCLFERIICVRDESLAFGKVAEPHDWRISTPAGICMSVRVAPNDRSASVLLAWRA
jgi:hypothetical protein